MQTTHSQDLASAVAGMPGDGEYEVHSFAAQTDIPFGRIVVWDNTNKTVALPSATTLGDVVGVSLYPDLKTPYAGPVGATNAYGYKAGEMVRVLRKGRVWAETEGTALAPFARANIRHASTGAAAEHRGKVTASAANVSAGAETTQGPTSIVAYPPPATSTAPAGLVLLDVNLPA